MAAPCSNALAQQHVYTHIEPPGKADAKAISRQGKQRLIQLKLTLQPPHQRIFAVRRLRIKLQPLQYSLAQLASHTHYMAMRKCKPAGSS